MSYKDLFKTPAALASGKPVEKPAAKPETTETVQGPAEPRQTGPTKS